MHNADIISKFSSASCHQYRQCIKQATTTKAINSFSLSEEMVFYGNLSRGTFSQLSTQCVLVHILIILSTGVQSVSGMLDRPRVVAPSKTCGHVRSSRRRWRSAQCRPRSAAPTFGRVVLAGASTPA